MWTHRGARRPDFAHVAAPGQESVWDYPRPPRIVADARHVIVSANGHVLADTWAALRVCETASPPTFYLPIDDVDLDALAQVPGTSYCEWKGAARYWTIVDDRPEDARPETGTPVAWDYPQPTPAFAALASHLAFYPALLDCLVDGERVRPQSGQFYGGWVTDDVVGPFKGEPGTGHW